MAASHNEHKSAATNLQYPTSIYNSGKTMDKTCDFSKEPTPSLQEFKYSYRHHTAHKYVLKLLSLSGIILSILFYF
jgi:hypothetical protein